MDKIVLSPVFPQFCPRDKTYSEQGSEVQKSHPFFASPPPAIGNNNAVAGQKLLIVATSANHSAAAVASVGDNDDNKEEAMLQAGIDANGQSGRRRRG